VFRTRLFSAFLLASLALTAQPCGFAAPADAGYERSPYSHGQSPAPGPVGLTAADEDDGKRRVQLTDDPDLVPLIAEAPASRPELRRSEPGRECLIGVVRHSPCAAPQTGPPSLHASA